MDGEDFDLGPSNPFVSPAPASRAEEGGWVGPSNPFLGTNGDGPLSFTSNPGTPGSRGYYDDDDNDAISPASGSMMDRTRSSLIAEQDLLDLSDVDESDESDEDEAFLANSLAPRELVRWSAGAYRCSQCARASPSLVGASPDDDPSLTFFLSRTQSQPTTKRWRKSR